ncbi:MAG TPA: divalent metal cation transporter [Vicinamibacterales bacterium]|nr:divalent metal cation transporter [Vicinamibacterales bacterium]
MSSTTTASSRTARSKTRRGLLERLGPGLITGASDDDPSGIATYTQAGSLFGLGLLWTMLFSYPLMGGIQEISARIGIVTGRGLAANLRTHAVKPVLIVVVAVLLVANSINIAADIGAMASSLRLLAGGRFLIYVALFGVVSTGLQIFVPYHRYVPYLKWLCLAVFAYIGIAFVVRIPWTDVLANTFVPHAEWSRPWLMVFVAIFGTTISPYLFFWQASEEVEDQQIDPWEQPLNKAPEQSKYQLGRMRLDTWFGMGISNLVSFSVILTAAVVFHAHGVFNIQTTQQAAEALQPIAGRFAHLLFSIGIIGTGLLALPVLAGSSAYAVGEAMRWPIGLEKTPSKAPAFYLVIAGMMAAGMALNLLRVNPIAALFWAAVINGVASPPIMITIMLLANRRSVMGHFTLTRRLLILGWAGTGVMTAAAAAMFITMRG